MLISPSLLAPDYDYDFSQIVDTKSFYRGGRQYYRPCGWRRFAIDVSGQFDEGSDVWLGSSNKTGEWCVSYHGTKKENLEKIIEEGFRIDKGKRFLYGKGIYSTPRIEIAEKFADACEIGGYNFLVVVQNRIDPSKLLTANDGKYFLCEEKAVRPYGICIKRVA